jgi:TonB family protein
MRQVLRIADRFINRRNPDSIDAQGRLGQTIVLVVVFHMIMLIGFVRMYEMEKKHPRVIHEVDYAFDLSAPPLDLLFRPMKVLAPPRLLWGKGVQTVAKALPPTTPEMIKPPEPRGPHSTPAAQPLAKFSITKDQMLPPSITHTNEIKMRPLQPPRQGRPEEGMESQSPGIAPVLSELKTSESHNPRGVEQGHPGVRGESPSETDDGLGIPGTRKPPRGEGGGIDPTLSPGTRSGGVITYYRNDLLARIARNWRPGRKPVELTALISLDHDGRLRFAEITKSSGNKNADRHVIEAIRRTEFAPLPEWYSADTLEFEILMTNVGEVSE